MSAAWWDAPEGRQTHFVEIPCLCGSAEDCTTSLYVSDVRIAQAEIAALRAQLAGCQPEP